MANKKTIQQLEVEIDRYMRKLNYALNHINMRRELIKKIRMGKVKQPPPPGKKIITAGPLKRKGRIWDRAGVHEDFDDDLPSFGGNPNTSFD